MNAPKTRAFSTRLSEKDREIIRHAADLIGVTPSSLIRDGAIAEAEKIISDPEAFAVSRVRRLIRERRKENLLSHGTGYIANMLPELTPDGICADRILQRELAPD